jgi:hypothetical protein
MAVVAVYAAAQFGPPHYRKWKAKGILSVSANNIYPKRMLSGDAEAQFHEEIRRNTENQLRALGISDPNLRISIFKTPQEIGVSADYQEFIKHPLIGKTTVLHFRPYNMISTN